MKNSKGFLSAIAVAVLVSALQLVNTDFSPKSLQTNVPGYSIPVDTTYSSFGCKSPGSWSNTVWCQAYGSTYELHVTDANKHANVIVMFKRSGTVSGGFGLPYGSDYYVVGDYGSSAVGKNGQTYNKDSFVKCPSGATMQYHLRSHHLYSPSLGEGFYDGEGHYWCELNSAAVDPEKLDGRPAGVQLPDSEDINMHKLYPISFPGGTVKYKKIDDPASFYKCSNGYEGPYEPGVNQYLNTYHVKESWKKPYYRCLTADVSGFENALSDGSMADFTASTGPTNISASMFGLNDAKNCSADYTTCQPSCAAGDSTCGGSGTYVTSGAFCASNTYIFQTTDYNTRYCAASPTTGIYAPPTIYSATITHVNYATSGDTVSAAVGGTLTIIPGVKSYHPWIEIKNTGNTSDTYTFSHTNTSSDSNVSAGKIKDCVYTVNDAPVTSVIIAAGASQKVRLQCNVEDVDPNGVVLTQSLIVGSQGKWQKLGPYTYNITTKKQAVCGLNIQLNDNKTSYTQGDMVNYSYYCSPTGTTAATTYVYVVKPDGSSTLYTSGTNSSAITLGFSTSNLTAGSYTLKVCADSACTLNSASIPFTVVAASTTPTIGEITLNGTIFKDGQYVDPATSALRNCVSPKYWMKEGPTSSGARGFHCMPNMPNYTLTSDHYPPTPCAGTLWASSSSTTTTFSSDYCATSKDSTPPPPPPTLCNYDGVCNNGETSATCAADCSYTPPSTCKLGQKDCDPNLSCDQGKRCYVGGKLSCLDWDATCGGNTCAPAGTSQYYPGCKEAGSITDRVGDDFPGNCDYSMSCYSKDDKKRYCQPMSTTTMPAFPPSCTNPDFPKGCSPFDTSCWNIGEGGTSGYCEPAGKECYAEGSTSFTCIPESEACKGSVCPTDPKDPRSQGCTAEGKGPKNGWCAINNSVMFYEQVKDGGIWCMKNPDSTDMYFWETLTPPAGYDRCRFEDVNNGCMYKLNVPIKKETGKGYWCAIGMRQDDDANGTVTCVSGRDYKPPRDTEPPIKVCQDVTSVAYNPSTLECRTFSSSCLSEGWVPLGVNQICENGKVIELSDVTDDKSLIQIIDKKLSFLDTIRYSLKELPVSLSETTALRELVEKGTIALKDLRAKLPAKTAKARGDISEELERINKNIIADIEDKWAKVQAYIDFAHLRDEITAKLTELKHEASACDQSTDYCKYINDVIPTLESLLGAAEGQTGNVFEQLVTDIRTTWDKLQKRMIDERGGHRDTFFANQIQKLLDDREKIRNFIKDRTIEDAKITYLFSDFDSIVTYLQNIVSSMEFEVIPKEILEKAFRLKARLEGYLATYGYEVTEVRSWEDLMPFVQEEVKKQLELLFPKIEQTVRVLMDEALQELALNMVKIVEELKPEIQEAVAQGISNLSIELNERRKEILDEVIAAKNEIVKSLGDLERVIDERLGTFTANRYRTDVIEVVAPVVWCGDYASTIESRINNAGLAIENGESIDFGELHTFVTDAMADNVIECRRIGASRFYMPIESWYWPYVEESAEKGCIKGYSDASGTVTGYFGEADPTRRIEAVKMVSCIFSVPEGDATTDRSDVPPWGAPYFNGLKAVVPGFDWSLPMDKEITRFEIAELVVRTMLALDKDNVVTEADKVELVEDFTDASQVVANKYALAVETLVDFGVFKGHADGHFGGYDFTLRSEFAAILDRINDLIVEMYGIGGRDDVAIGTPPGN